MKHYNPTINKSMSDIFNLKGESTDEISNEILPVINIHPKVNITRAVYAANAASTTIYTTPSDKDFFLTTVSLQVIRSTASVNVVVPLKAYIDGVLQTIISVAGITLVAQDQAVALSFPIPIKIDRGTAIVVTISDTTPVIAIVGSVSGYTVETIKNT